MCFFVKNAISSRLIAYIEAEYQVEIFQMLSVARKQAKLILETGEQFAGESFGFTGPADGEVVFNTGMTGFELSLTDPSYAGQILTFTFPLVGNFGIPSVERDEHGILKYFESEKIHVRGVIVTNGSEDFSHYRAKKSLEDWLIANKIPAITGIDTRRLTQTLREHGTCLGQIVQDGGKVVKNIEDPNKINLVADVSIKKEKILIPKNHIGKTIIAIDTGIKNNILRCFLRRGIKVIFAPWDFDITNTKYKYDGLFLANGPGDPKMVADTIAKNIVYAYEKEIPVFGICLGNQIISLALGGDTYKLPYGHRGVNQPCQEQRTENCYVTSQNHGFAVDPKKLPKGFEVWFKNLNDNSIEGVRHKSKPIFSVQFHPEACPGPQDTEYLFDEFIAQL